MKKNTRKKWLLLLAVLATGTGFARAEDGTRRGDANGDGTVNVTDAVIAINKYHNIAEPTCPVNADANGDDTINVTDAVVIINLYHYGSVDASGTIDGWTEGNEGEELTTHDLEEEGD